MIYCLGDLQTAEFRRLGAKDKKKRKSRFGFSTAGQGARTGAAIGALGVGGYGVSRGVSFLARPESQEALRRGVLDLGGGTRGKLAAAGMTAGALGAVGLIGGALGAPLGGALGAAGGYIRSRLANQKKQRRR